MQQTRGHITDSGDYEYYERGGDVYRALKSNPLDVDGYRMGGRFECGVALLPQLLALLQAEQEEAR